MNPQKGIAQYTCPGCRGIMAFDPKEGKLKCPYCGTLASEEELQNQELAAEGQPTQTDTVGWGKEAQQMLGYHCSSCGAELLADAHTIATRCPYCGNNAVTTNPFRETIRPDYVIPFRFSREEAKNAYREYQKKRFFLPAAFTQSSYVDEIQGVYVPFWLFSGKAEGEILFTASDKESAGTGKDKKTTKKEYEALRAGTLDFARIPVDASARMPDDLMDSLEPYDYGALQPFTLACLPGFLAEAFDVSDKESGQRADLRMTNTFRQEMKETVRHDNVKAEKEQIRIRQKQTEYGLLPVWLLSTKWNDKTYLFAMNGQSGKIIGNLPVHKGKKWGFIAICFVAILLALHLAVRSWIADILIAVFVTLIIQAIALGGMKPVSKRTKAEQYRDGELQLTKKEEHLVKTETT